MSRNQGVQTSGSTGGDNGAVQTGLGDNVHLNGGVAARVVHGTGVNLSNRHFEVGQADGVEEISQLQGRKREMRGFWGFKANGSA